MKNIENWKSVVGYEGLYEVSNLGRIKTFKYLGHKGKISILKPEKMKNGYLRVTLTDYNGNRKRYQIHRLVATAFIPNPDNLPVVDHINTIRDDNRVKNLRWVTHKENSNNNLTIQHIKENTKGKKHKNPNNKSSSKPVIQYDKNMKYIQRFESAAEASRQNNICNTSISDVCKGREHCHTAGGYIWRFEK